MPISEQRQTVIGIINEVERRLGVSESTQLNTTKLTTVLVDHLNDVLDDVSNYGDLPEMFREVQVTASSSVTAYEVAVSGNLKNIYEIHWSTAPSSPLNVRSISEIRRLQKLRSYGVPRSFAMTEVSGVNPIFRGYPIPGTSQNNLTFDVAYYKKPRLYTAVTADSTATPAFPSRMLVAGVLARALLEESGYEETSRYKMTMLD